MTLDPDSLIASYLDETLTATEHAALGTWLNAAPENASRFAQAVFLHDRLRSELLATATINTKSPPTQRVSANRQPYRDVRSVAALTGGFIMAVVFTAMLWKGVGETPASAAVVELNRLIIANAQPTDRTYQITVEETALPPNLGKHLERPENRRPPKPPMDSALLHVRGGRQFVLVRKTVAGLPFITGSNGQTSWAVRPDGPVRVSSDLNRFSHDLPGHEHSMPLINIQDGLKQLLEAYDVELLPIENLEDEVNLADGPSRLIVAVKKRGFRGPRRVEITYSVNSDLIRQIRFVEMPYGPERLTLRMTLVEERNLGDEFFDHQSHHAPERAVEIEE